MIILHQVGRHFLGLMFGLGFILSGAPLAAQSSGVDLFHRGQYTAAYAALWPGISAGEPEAAFYGLIIRRNGLDGRAPADSKETAALWRILLANADLMRGRLKDPAFSQAVKDAYLTALAQLDFFGATPPSWPPAAFPCERQAELFRSISSSLSGPSKRFTPAMNFQAFMEMNVCENREKTAFKLVLRSAETGDYLAMGNLAWMYRTGLGTSKNNLRAAHWARQGAGAVPPVPRAQNELGYCYEAGLGVSQDQAEAERWYKSAAAQGYGPAKTNAGRLKKSSKSVSPSAAVLDNWLAF